MSCPLCGETAKEGQRFCTECGWELSEPVVWCCRHCYKSLEGYDKDMIDYCPHCGKEADGNFLTTTEIPKRKRKPKGGS